MSFANELWAVARPVYMDLIQHRFYAGLREGDLPLRCFRHFLQQDALYLQEDARAFRLLSARMEHREEAGFLHRLAEEGIATEEEMQRSYFRAYQIGPAREMMPGLRSYTQYLVGLAETGPVAFALAALLPCYWLFREVGWYAREHSVPGNPYQNWLDTYADPEYAQQTEQLKQLTVQHARKKKGYEREEMKSLFLKSCRYELLFAEEVMQESEGNSGGHHHPV